MICTIGGGSIGLRPIGSQKAFYLKAHGVLTLLFVRQRDEPLSRLLADSEANIVATIETVS